MSDVINWSDVLQGFSLEGVVSAMPERGPRMSTRPCLRTCTTKSSEAEVLVEWTQMLEALELLALIAIVAPRSWQSAARAVGVYKFDTSVAHDEDASLPLNALNRLCFRHYDLAVLQVLTTSPIARSDAYHQARNTIQALAKTKNQRARCDAMRLPIVIGVADADQLEEVLKRADQLKSPHAPYEFWGVDLCCEYITPPLVSAIERAVERDVCLHGMMCRSLSMYDRSVTSRVTSALLRSHGAQWLNLCAPLTNTATAEVFFSALSTASDRLLSLRLVDMVLDGSTAARRCMLLWMFSALFNCDARHSLHELQLLVARRGFADDLRWLANTIRNHSAPRTELFIEDAFEEYVDREAPVVEQYVSLQHGDVVRTKTGDAWLESAVVVDEATQLRVLRDDGASPFIDVLLPSYGRCWVERSPSTVIVTRPVKPWDLKRHPIRNLNLDLLSFKRVDHDNIFQLLHLIGTPIVKLVLGCSIGELAMPWLPLQLADLQNILHSCPRLESLSLRWLALDSPQVLIDLFNDPKCRLRSLELGQALLPNLPDYVLLADALTGDSNTTISRNLREISVDFRVTTLRACYPATYATRQQEQAVANAWLRVLSTNHSLQRFEATFSSSLAATFRPLFEQYNNERLHIRMAPLHIRTKCALLSVAARGRFSALLVPELFGQVMEMAAECERRVVRLQEFAPLRNYRP